MVDALLLHLLLMAAPESGITRRVCVLQGAETYAAPALTRRVTRPRRSMPLALEAGTYVTLTGQRANGFVRVQTLGERSSGSASRQRPDARRCACRSRSK